jgi:hypothetical protein
MTGSAPDGRSRSESASSADGQEPDTDEIKGIAYVLAFAAAFSSEIHQSEHRFDHDLHRAARARREGTA